jgi:hypothetical protein
VTTINESRKIIYDKFITLWGATSLYTFDNEQFDEPESSPWIRLTIRNSVGSQETLGVIGNRKYNRQAEIKVQVFTLANTGTQKSDEITTAVQNIFEGNTFDRVYIDNSSINEIGVDGKWFMALVDISFFYDETK